MTDHVNVDVLRAELEFVTAHPDRWRQAVWLTTPDPATAEPGVDWTCGTAACLAGWTLLRAGYEPHLDGDGRLLNDSCVVAPGTGPAVTRLVDVREAARRRLGLSDDQAELLFDPSNNLRDLWEFARVFTDGALRVPAAVAADSPAMFDFDEETDGAYDA